MRDPWVLGRRDPTAIIWWLKSKGHDVRGRDDPDNFANRPIPVCANPSCNELLIDRPAALYHSRKCKEAHVQAKRVAAREAAETKEILT